MEVATKARRLSEMFRLIPVEGEPNVYTLHSSEPAIPTDREMTEEDWDKFEKDINDACERIDDPIPPL